MRILSKLLLATALVSSFAVNFAQATLGDEMKAIASKIGTVLNATDSKTMVSDLEFIREHALAAKDFKPKKLSSEADNSPSVLDYEKGINEFVAQVDETIKVAKTGDLEAAKETAKSLISIRNIYHGKYY